ncbi:MAG: alpha/beta fold hydrolase [Acidimicrobiales bacterium]|nr:MAG: alpha/beta fold hydrolase [Acidimicrobiales bacterium]
MAQENAGMARNRQTELHYVASGDSTDPALVFVNGLGSQLINFLPGWVSKFRDAGFYVIRMDNRDVGMSSKTSGDPPNMEALIDSWSQDRSVRSFTAAYDLSDMAADCVAVMDALDVERAHVWGMSMGGMIAQTLAINHADRLRSMTTVMSTTGEAGVGQSTPESAAQLVTVGHDREDVVNSAVAARRVHSGSLYDESWARSLEEAAYDRCYHPQGKSWQLLAIMASGSRVKELPMVTTPTMVIHGQLDSLVQVDGGEATAALIPGAELVIHDQMGHDIPEPLWRHYLADFQRLVARAN